MLSSTYLIQAKEFLNQLSKKSFNQDIQQRREVNPNSHRLNLTADLFGDKVFTDVTFKLRDGSLSAHKNVLATSSDHFMNLFSTDAFKDNSVIEKKNVDKRHEFKRLFGWLFRYQTT